MEVFFEKLTMFYHSENLKQGSAVVAFCWISIWICVQGCKAKQPVISENSQETGISISYISPNRDFVRQAETGQIDFAVVSWWGFNEHDSTEFLQAAICSGAKFLLIPNMGLPWVVGPIELAADQYLLFEPGTVIQAKAGAFLGAKDALFSIVNKDNITLEGRGATLRMRKEDYTQLPYPLAEWRHCLSIRGSHNVKVSGLTLENSGGDGIYIGRGIDDPERIASRNITIRNCVIKNNHRQGISIVSAVDVLIESCHIVGTHGTKPMTGVDFEPNRSDEFLQRIILRNCIIEKNAGGGVQFWFEKLNSTSKRVNISVEGCTIRDNGWWAFQIYGLNRDDSPIGVIRFNNNLIEGLKLVWPYRNFKIEFK